MIQKIDTNAIKESINLIEIAGNRTELRRESSREYSGPCPICGGTDRFHVQESKFMCRTCHPDWGDAIEFLMVFDNLDFQQACARLSGTVVPGTTYKQRKPERKAAATDNWQEAKERAALLSSHDGLMAGSGADVQAVMAYLVGRGIEAATVAAFKLGYRLVFPPRAFDYDTKTEAYPKQLAVALPWFDAGGKLMAVKYRFIEAHTYTDVDGKERTENKTSRCTQGGRMFGWQALRGPDHCRTLFIAEGELNALSIWQASGGAVDVLSAGSESTTQHLPTDVVELAKQYQQCFLWADRGEIADTAAAAIGAYSIPSFKTEQHPKGLDANDLLQAGKLGDFLGRLGIEQAPQANTPLDLVGQVIDAQRFYELQRETAAMGWTLHGTRHGAVIDGYCNEWKITRAVAP